ncbi:MAG: AraC family transcriptional regulator [Mogibacterium sp.]|nr:AraC family transcriptional regulator [Mogibacterium sp.]
MKAPIKRYVDDKNTLRVESFYHILVDPGQDVWSFPLHTHSDLLEISLIVAGKARFECNRVKYTLKPGDLIVKNAGVLHSETSSPEDGFEQYCLGISGVQFPDMPPDTMVPEGISPVIETGSAYEYLRSMTAYIYELSSGGIAGSDDLIRQAVEHALSLVSMLIAGAVEMTEKTAHSPLVSGVLDYIETHVGETMSLDSLAKQFYVSTYHLAHKFKEETGCTVNQYILSRKLGEAQQRLVFSDDPIKEIAADCGYSSLQYFYSVFKKYTGSTPAEIRHTYNQILSAMK